MESTATTPTKRAAAAPHPFNGDFRSIRINSSLDEDDDGVIHLEIPPGGETFSGTHTPAGGTPTRLERVILNRRVIQVRTTNGRFWHGSIISLLGDTRKIVVGRYHIPGSGPGLARDEKDETAAPGQDNGTWVATQP